MVQLAGMAMATPSFQPVTPDPGKKPNSYCSLLDNACLVVDMRRMPGYEHHYIDASSYKYNHILT